MKEKLKRANDGLPTIKVKGKKYVMVKDRVAAFRQNFEDWAIVTEILSMKDDGVVIKASVINPEHVVKATGIAEESKATSAINKTSYVENCETSAIGRALACLGIGIDDSYGSADEVASAISQQESQRPLSQEKLKNLVGLVMKRRGTDKFGAVEIIQEITGKENSADLNAEDYVRVVQEVDHE